MGMVVAAATEQLGNVPFPGRNALIHLAHVTGWGYGELMAMPIAELADWYDEVVAYWNRINAGGESSTRSPTALPRSSAKATKPTTASTRTTRIKTAMNVSISPV
jgi:glucan biosynthesis protein